MAVLWAEAVDVPALFCVLHGDCQAAVLHYACNRLMCVSLVVEIGCWLVFCQLDRLESFRKRISIVKAFLPA